MKLLSPIDVTVLTWLKPELDSTLLSARTSLERFVEEGQGITSLRECSGHLHQVAGILNMVELTGAARLAEEMERLSLALADGAMPNADNAFSLLMQCIVQLPDYLERLQNGNRDVPVVLLPLVNELRSIRGEGILGEEAVYSAPTQQPLPDDVLLQIRSQADDTDFGSLSLQFQAHLQGWLNNAADADAPRKLASVCGRISAQCREESSRKLFWVASALLAALADRSIERDDALKQSLVKVDQEVNFLNHRGIGEIRHLSPVRLTQELLYFVARDAGASPALKQVYDVFELASIVPDEEEIAHAKSSLLGRNNALLESVAAVIKEDILRIKDTLDLSIRQNDKNPADMAELVTVLARIENTLGLIDAKEAREHIRGNRETIQAYVDGSSPLNDGELMAIAKSLLSVEFMLDYHGSDAVGRQSRLASDFMASSQSHQLLDALIRESIVNFMQVRQAYVAFVESYWDHQQLSVIPALLKQVSGALAILEYTPVSAYIDAVNAYTRAELIDGKGIPNGDQMERLAEVLASLEYYLESVRDRRPSRERILEITRKSLEALHYWPVPEKSARAAERDMPAAPAAAVAAAVPAAVPTQAPSVPDSEPAAASPVIVVDETGDLIDGFDFEAEGIDDEIREIFLEEFNEENANLAVFFKDWQTDPDNIELIRPIRRVFHTLKGSGRLVGAKALSEFSWKIESLLNRVLDGSRPVSDPVVTMIKRAIATLPTFHKALTGERVSLDLIGLNDTSDRLAAGEEIYYRSQSAAEVIPATAAESAVPEAISTPGTEVSVAGAEPVIDPVLLEILKPEVSGHLQTVNEWLQRASASGSADYDDGLFRAIHTMNGAFAMSEVATMSGVLAPAEALVRRGIAHKIAANAESIACLAQVADAVQATLDDLSQNTAPNPYPELESWVAAKRDELPEMPSSVPTPMALADMAAEAAAEQAAAEAAAEQAAAEQAAAEQAAAEQAAAEQAAAEQAA
uniref:Hpt domain-containing protein n=1 Tax=Arenimonas sp. GDDSR-1 TaxID=2950125 RepID=UPI0026229EE9